MSSLENIYIQNPDTPQEPEAYGFTLPEEQAAYYKAMTEGQRAGMRLAVETMVQTHQEEIDEHTAYQQEMEHRLTHDSMVPELWSKEAFERILDERLTNEIPTGLLFCDFDGFKALNDTYGHGMGDEVIISFGSRLAKQLRTVNYQTPGHEDVVSHKGQEDVLGDSFSEGSRFGGDEFSVMFYSGGRHNFNPTAEEEHDAGWVVAERVVDLFHDAKKEVEEKHLVQLDTDISVGMVIARRGETAKALMKRADEAMYEVKHNKPGREER